VPICVRNSLDFLPVSLYILFPPDWALPGWVQLLTRRSCHLFLAGDFLFLAATKNLTPFPHAEITAPILLFFLSFSCKMHSWLPSQLSRWSKNGTGRFFFHNSPCRVLFYKDMDQKNRALMEKIPRTWIFIPASPPSFHNFLGHYYSHDSTQTLRLWPSGRYHSNLGILKILLGSTRNFRIRVSKSLISPFKHVVFFWANVDAQPGYGWQWGMIINFNTSCWAKAQSLIYGNSWR